MAGWTTFDRGQGKLSAIFEGCEAWTEMPSWGLNLDSPPAQSRKCRLFWRIARFQR
jgi:hypothetical protein